MQMRQGMTGEDVILDKQVQTAEATDEVWGAIRDIEAHVQHLDASVKADQLQCEKFVSTNKYEI